MAGHSANEDLRAARERTCSPRVPGAHLSRAELAEAVNAWLHRRTNRPGALDAHYIGRLERGAVRWPGREYRAALRSVLGADTDAALGFHPPGRSAPKTTPNLPTEVDPVRVLGAEDSERLAAPRGPDRAGFDALAAVLSSVRRLEDETSAADVLPSVLAQQTLVEKMTAEARPGVRPTAVGLASEISQYLGWLHIAGKGWSEARRHLDRAVVLGMEAEDPVRLATALSFQAYRAALTGDLLQAAALSEASARDHRIHPGLRTYLAFQRASIAAQGGQTAKAARLLTEADRRVADLPPAEELPEIGYWYRPSFFLGQRALILHSLGDVSAARSAAADCLAELPAGWSEAEWIADVARLVDRRPGDEPSGQDG